MHPSLRSLAVLLLSAFTVGCGNPLQVATWLELTPGSQVEAAGQSTPIEGGVFVRIDVDLSNLLRPVGTIEVDQVRIGGVGGLFGTMCLRKDDAFEGGGSFSFDLLTGEQIVDFPFATIASSSSLDLLGLGEIAVLASPSGLAFPTDPAIFAPVFEEGSMDGLLTLPVSLDQEFELAPGFSIPAVVDLILTSSSRPHVFEDPALIDYCEPRWALQDQPAPFILNPKGTYLHHVNEENPQPPLVVSLEEIGALPGDTLTLTRGGRWEGFFQGNQRRIAAVFSGSDVLLPVERPATWANFWHWLNFRSVRVADAIDAGIDVVTPLTLAFLNRSDIPQDFEVVAQGVEIVVPEGATHLFFTPIDIAYSDNYTSSLRVSIAVTPAP